MITQDIDFVNKMPSEGQYFFANIEQEGILLCDAGNTPLAERNPNFTTVTLDNKYATVGYSLQKVCVVAILTLLLASRFTARQQDPMGIFLSIEKRKSVILAGRSSLNSPKSERQQNRARMKKGMVGITRADSPWPASLTVR